MDFADFILTFFLLWWLVLFCILPLGVQPETHVEVGNDTGAPKFARLRRKVILTTAIALVCTGALDLLIHYEILDLRAIFFGMESS